MWCNWVSVKTRANAGRYELLSELRHWPWDDHQVSSATSAQWFQLDRLNVKKETRDGASGKRSNCVPSVIFTSSRTRMLFEVANFALFISLNDLERGFGFLKISLSLASCQVERLRDKHTFFRERETQRLAAHLFSQKRDFYGCAMNDYNEKKRIDNFFFFSSSRLSYSEERNVWRPETRILICMEMKSYW